MTRTIAINGTRLDEVRMPMPPPGNGTLSSLSYPLSQIRLSRAACGLCLIIPAYLAVELYRIGILPQDANLPVEVSIGSRSAGWYRVSDVRYPSQSQGPFWDVTFTLTRVLQEAAGSAVCAPPLAQSAAVEGSYVTDITHYLDEAGELLPLPGPARKIASFLVLVIDAATSAEVGDDHATGIRCRKKSCQGTIRTLLLPDDQEIFWRCPVCEHHGVIRNWQDTKWNQLKGTEEPR